MPEGDRLGIVLAGGHSKRLRPLTFAHSKQLLPVYDKPMFFYPLSILMLAGIRDIVLVTSPRDQMSFAQLVGDGRRYGVKIRYAIQASPAGIADVFNVVADLVSNRPSALVLGDNFLYGHALTNVLASAMAQTAGATIFTCPVDDPTQYGVVELGTTGQPIRLVEKPVAPTSNLAVPGLYFYDGQACSIAQQLLPSARGELEITDLNQRYLDLGMLSVQHLGRGTAWLDMGTHASLLAASNFVATVQERQGLAIACLEEIAYQQGWISRAELTAGYQLHAQSSYGAYIHKLLE